MTASQTPGKPAQGPPESPEGPDGPLISLRSFVLIVAALVVAAGASACVYWHKQWVIVGVGVFAAALAYFNRSVK